MTCRGGRKWNGSASQTNSTNCLPGSRSRSRVNGTWRKQQHTHTHLFAGPQELHVVHVHPRSLPDLDHVLAHGLPNNNRPSTTKMYAYSTPEKCENEFNVGTEQSLNNPKRARHQRRNPKQHDLGGITSARVVVCETLIVVAVAVVVFATKLSDFHSAVCRYILLQVQQFQPVRGLPPIPCGYSLIFLKNPSDVAHTQVRGSTHRKTRNTYVCTSDVYCHAQLASLWVLRHRRTGRS